MNTVAANTSNVGHPRSGVRKSWSVEKPCSASLRRTSGFAAQRKHWAGTEEITAAVLFLREPLFVCDVTPEGTTLVQMYHLDGYGHASLNVECVKSKLLSASEAAVIVNACFVKQVIPLMVALHHGVEADQTGHFTAIRFQDQLYKSWSGCDAAGETMRHRMKTLQWGLGFPMPDELMIMIMRCIEERLDDQQYPSQALPPEVMSRWVGSIYDAVTRHPERQPVAVLVLDYAGGYDSAIHGFDLQFWADDVWFVNVLNEFQLILVGSWGDLVTRVLFSVGMISSTNVIKNLVRPKSNRVRICQPSGPIGEIAVPLVGVLPAAKENADKSERSLPDAKARPLFRSFSIVLAPKSLGARRKTLTRGFSVFFFLWGFAIITLHSPPGLNLNLAQYKLQVRPRFMATPACSLVELDCYSTGINGSLAKVQALWREFEAHTVVQVVVKHCTSLEVPHTLQRFHNLDGMKFYNSTIADWGQDTAVTNTFHPKIMPVLFVRVNFSEGALPLGLQASKFPHLLADIELCVTNLETLPDDLDLKWPKHGTVYLEVGTMTVVPDVLARLAPFYLSFAGSPIQELPATLFEARGIDYLHAGGTKISSLPQNVTHMGRPLSHLILQDTDVSLFWPWIDERLEGSSVIRVCTEETPYCERQNQLVQSSEDVITADQLALNSTSGAVGSSRLMNFSKSNQDYLLEKVSCKKTVIMVYPLVFEDEYRGIKASGAGGRFE